MNPILGLIAAIACGFAFHATRKSEAQTQLAESAQHELAGLKLELDSARNESTSWKRRHDQAAGKSAELDKAQQELATLRKEARDRSSRIQNTDSASNEQAAAFENLKANLAAAEAMLATSKEEVASAKAELANARAELDTSRGEIQQLKAAQARPALGTAMDRRGR